MDADAGAGSSASLMTRVVWSAMYLIMSYDTGWHMRLTRSRLWTERGRRDAGWRRSEGGAGEAMMG